MQIFLSLLKQYKLLSDTYSRTYKGKSHNLSEGNDQNLCRRWYCGYDMMLYAWAIFISPLIIILWPAITLSLMIMLIRQRTLDHQLNEWRQAIELGIFTTELYTFSSGKILLQNVSYRNSIEFSTRFPFRK